MNTRKWLTGFIAVTTLLFMLTLLLFSQGEATLAQEADVPVYIITEDTSAEPMAAPDFYYSWTNQSLSVNFLRGVSANDLNLTPSVYAYGVELVDNVTQGTLELGLLGNFIYTPNTDFVGKDTFTYKLFYPKFDEFGDLVDTIYYNTTTVTLIVGKLISDVPQILDVVNISSAPVIPRFSWSYLTSDSPDAPAGDWYNLKLSKNDVTVYDEWFKVDFCSFNVCDWTLADYETGVPVELYENGAYEWTIQAWTWTNDAETEGELSEPSTTGYFNINLPPAGLPDFMVQEDQQGFLAIHVEGDDATSWLNIYITSDDGTQVVYADWFHKDPIYCSGSCYIPLALANGKYKIYIQGWGPGGYSSGGISNSGFAGKKFTHEIDAPVAVSGVTVTNANTGRPTFEFLPTANTPLYNIQMSVDGNMISDNWYTVDLIDSSKCYLSPSPEFFPSVPCRFTPDILLENGAEVDWKVGVWGPGLTGDIPYFEGSFTVNSAGIQAPVLVKPTGTVTTVFLGFEWQPVDASWYHVVIEQGNTIVYDKWSTYEEAYCYLNDSGNCVVYYYNLSNGGSYTFKVQGYGPAGLGDFSADMAFTIDLP